MESQEKECSVCKSVKTIDAFYRRPSNYVEARCRSCENQRVAAWAKSPAGKAYHAYWKKTPKAKDWDNRRKRSAAGKIAKRRQKSKARTKFSQNWLPQQIDDRTDGRCGRCGKPVFGDRHYDHVIPVARGGNTVPGNLVLMHPRCNMAKGARIVKLAITPKPPLPVEHYMDQALCL